MGEWIRWVGNEMRKEKKEERGEEMGREWYLRTKREEERGPGERACLPEREGGD